jgi:tetratricopeptide (TPR) repeat protein
LRRATAIQNGYSVKANAQAKILGLRLAVIDVVLMDNALEHSLKRYRSATTAIGATSQLSSEQILEVLFARDQVQIALQENKEGAITLLRDIVQIDSQLKESAGLISQGIVLPDCRASLHPNEEAWWWFLDRLQPASQLMALNQYETALDALEKNFCQLRHSEVDGLVSRLAHALLSRDALQNDLSRQTTASKDWAKVNELDQRLRAWVTLFPKQNKPEITRRVVAQMEDLRNVTCPSEDAWWWFPKIPSSWWNRFDPVWSVLTILWLTATFSLLTDICSRFLSGGEPGVFGAFAVILQSILALAGGGSLTKSGQLMVEQTLKRWKVPKHWWQATKFAAASLLLLLFIGFRLSLPQIAIVYNDAGVQDYYFDKQLGSAESKFKRSLALNPDNVSARYNLGSLYEDLGDLKQAEQQYNLAVAGRFVAAYNNLGRLYILAGKDSAAVNLLLKGVVIAEEEAADNVIRHNLYKNLGWARLKQSHYIQAKEYIETAIEIAGTDQKAATHCLLAQTLEKLDKKQEAVASWRKCLSNRRNPNNPEEDDWQQMASKHLNDREDKKNQ